VEVCDERQPGKIHVVRRLDGIEDGSGLQYFRWERIPVPQDPGVQQLFLRHAEGLGEALPRPVDVGHHGELCPLDFLEPQDGGVTPALEFQGHGRHFEPVGDRIPDAEQIGGIPFFDFAQEASQILRCGGRHESVP